MDKLKKVNIWRFVEGLGLDLKRKQLIGKLIEEIVDASIEGVPAADSNNIGGIKTGYTQNGKNYPILLDENKKAYVNVPWSDTNTTYEDFVGATANAAGQAGLVPAPEAAKQNRYLKADGSWSIPTDTKYEQATADKLGLVKIGYTANGKNYPILLDADGKMYVAVPWTDTKYTLPAATSAALGGVKQGAAVEAIPGETTLDVVIGRVNTLITNLKTAGVIA